jgi:nucleotide-binding universal stress UspA family protein
MEQSRQTCAETQNGAVRFHLSRACLEAGLDFDVRRTAGNPLKVLPHEARFHDLTVTSVTPKSSRKPIDTDFSLRDLASLLQSGVQPMLVAHPDQRPITRILMAYDGSDAAGRAIRSFLGLDIFTEAEHRLLAIGDTGHSARSALREVADYCFAKRRSLETGYVCGKPRRVLHPYAKKWQADLIVLGIARVNRLSGWFVGNPGLNLFSKLKCSIYVAS